MAAYFHPDMFRDDLGPGRPVTVACQRAVADGRSRSRTGRRPGQHWSASGKRDWRQVSDGSVR